MKKISRWGLGLSAAVAAFGLMAVAAEAQTTTTTPAPAAKPVTPPPAAKAPAGDAKAAAPAAAKKEKKPPSECAKLPEAECKAKPACIWVVPKKATDKNGKPLTAHCQKPGGFAAKKKDAAADQKGMSGMGGMSGMSGMAGAKKTTTPAPAPKQ